MRTVFETQDQRFRIIEVADDHATFEDLAGDMFDRAENPDIPEEVMVRQEVQFRDQIQEHGVYGYILEYWNPAPGVGYEHVESCFGFVGQYDASSEVFDHYIVDELKAAIPKGGQ